MGFWEIFAVTLVILVFVAGMTFLALRFRPAPRCRPVDSLQQLAAHSHENVQKIVVCGDYGRIQWGPNKEEVALMSQAIEAKARTRLSLPGCTSFSSYGEAKEPAPQTMKVEGMTELTEALKGLEPAEQPAPASGEELRQLLHQTNKKIRYSAPGITLDVEPVFPLAEELILTREEAKKAAGRKPADQGG